MIVYAREHEGESLIVAFNASASEKTVRLNILPASEILFGAAHIETDSLTLPPPRSGVVIK